MNINKSSKIIKNKLGLLNLAKTLGDVLKACKAMGFSRGSYYRFRDLIEEQVVAFAIDKPAYGQHRVSNELRKIVKYSSSDQLFALERA